MLFTTTVKSGQRKGNMQKKKEGKKVVFAKKKFNKIIENCVYKL